MVVQPYSHTDSNFRRRSASGGLPMGWFNWFGRKSHETVYAGRIYEAFVDDEMGDMTPDKLRVPKEALRRYQEKALFHREAFAFAALAKAATNDPLLLRVLMELERLIVTK